MLAPFMLSAQTPAPLVDLSEYHDDNRIKEMTDLNFTNITDGTYQIPALKVTELDYTPPHASMAFRDSAEVIACTEDVWSKITGNSGPLYVTVDAHGLTVAGDTITIITPGHYVILFGMSFNGGASDVYHSAIYKNNAITTFESHRKTANADTGYMGITGFLASLVAGDDISFKVMNSGDSDDPTMVSSQIFIYMLHP